MPTRKSGSSELQTDRRASLHRLSSIASFQALFSRRRSNNATDNINAASSSTSTPSLSSTVANAPKPRKPSAHSKNTPQHQNDSSVALPSKLPRRPSPPVPPSKNGYVCLPDDPIGGMPRSRTFSNLPLPTRTRKSTTLAQSQSHARLPSSQLVSTRLPTPPASTRRYSHMRLASTDMDRVPLLRTRTQPSETVPVFKRSTDQRQNLPRSTAFKENISLSPVKPLPTMTAFDKEQDSVNMLSSHNDAEGWRLSGIYNGGQARFGNVGSLSPRSAYAAHPAIQIAREAQNNPAYRDAKGRQSIPGEPMQQAPRIPCKTSEPVLVNTTNHHHSQHTEIKQTRLLSARQAPTPPPARTPLSKQALETSRYRSRTNSSTRLTRISDSPSTTRTSSPVKPDASASAKTMALTRLTEHVTVAEPSEYWCGRLSALVDQYRNQERAAHLSAGKISSGKLDSDKNKPGIDPATARIRRALEHLHDLCSTPEARDAFCIFQRQYAFSVRNPDLSRPIVLGSIGGCGQNNGNQRNKGSGSSEKSPGLRSEGRKVSLMDRLLGKQKRRSVGFA